jgi:hypothetical protein
MPIWLSIVPRLSWQRRKRANDDHPRTSDDLAPCQTDVTLSVSPWVLLVASAMSSQAVADDIATSKSTAMTAVVNGGPYNARFLAGGIGITRAIDAGDPILRPAAAFSFSGWVRPGMRQPGAVTLMALGDAGHDDCRCFGLDGGHLYLQNGALRVAARATVPTDAWTHVAATADGATLILYQDGREVARARGANVAVDAALAIAPVIGDRPHFGGALVEARLERDALGPAEIAARAATPPDFDLVQMRDVGVGWVWQSKANIGLFAQQDPWTLPRGAGRGHQPKVTEVPPTPSLTPSGPGHWQVGAWRLIDAPSTVLNGAALSLAGVDTSRWYRATVPGTVLTTLIDQGVYPDPYYGLDNLKIPEKLARQDYWYRTSFINPAAAGRQLRLRFDGINYAADIWVNDTKIGSTRGAFVRGVFRFDAKSGENTIAVRVSPPPHPGIPHEQSIAGGVGENGGQLAIDGPTFVATEGWDWIPGIRDRDTGLWQPVTLEATGPVRLGDPQIITDLPLPRTDSADILIIVPMFNDTSATQRVTVSAEFDDVRVVRTFDVPPGETAARFTPVTDPALRIAHPRLWWPNGYGDPALHDLTLIATADGVESDRQQTRFGIREVSYDLSLFDAAGLLRRVEVRPTDGTLRGERLIDVRHVAIKQSPGGWAESLTPAGESSPAVVPAPADSPLPHLTLRVNGVRIAARGGSWGMDDALKRSDRTRLEPYFQLERDAHMNIIRNWMGNNDEPAFYDLADENGLMVLNDFWQSTQDFQVEPQDPALFLANARDVIMRYRNHPSIVVWFGRNEGVPYPMLNEGLDDAVAELDGTRWYTGSSNVINLQGSGPYNYRPPEGYFTALAAGFSVETGSPSLSTLEAIEASIPAGDRWPLSDAFAYHDWHFSGNGDTATFMAALATMYGPATSLADFERKAQMMNLETYKAIFEGFAGHLWTRNSGRLLWMTHPSWPSNSWQIYSSDYDTHAAYYGAKKAAEPVHIQLNLPDNALVVVNTTQRPLADVRASVRVFGLDNQLLFERTDTLDAPVNQAVTLSAVPLARLFADHPMLLVSLRLTDNAGTPLDDNFYWRGRDAGAYRALNDLPAVALDVKLSSPGVVGEHRAVSATVHNPAAAAALNIKLTLVDAHGDRILPVSYSDNYIALLPGESRTILLSYPLAAPANADLAVRGWNVRPAVIKGH